MLVTNVQERKSGENFPPSLRNRRYLFACFSRAKASNHACNTGYLFPRVPSCYLGENSRYEGDQEVRHSSFSSPFLL